MVRSLVLSCVVLLSVLAPVARVHAQSALEADAPVTLRPAPEFRRLASRVALVLARRTGVTVTVGEAPPGDMIEAVPAGHIGIARRNEQLALVLIGAQGLAFEMEIALPPNANEEAVRELALAIESLRDAALEPIVQPAPAANATVAPTTTSTTTRWRIVNDEIREGGTPWETEGDGRLPTAKPTIYFRALLGISPVRLQPLVGLGTGLGLCLGDQCVVFEADVPLLADTRIVGGFNVRYRFLNFATRFQYRPWHFDRITPGFSLGVAMRIGSAEIQNGGGASSTANDFSVRATAEVAWRFHKLFELVLEAGLDYAVDRSTFLNRDGQVLILEDRWTPWLVTSVRLRP